MVICGIVLRRKSLDELKFEGVRDSKEIEPDRREELAKILRKKASKIKLIEFEPTRIDRLRKEGTNLNQIEEIGFVEILNQLDSQIAYVDAASANSTKFAENIQKKLNSDMKLVVEHKADENHLPVSAASIIAKVRRDRRIEELKEKYGDTGSGYPSDNRTIRFLEKWVRKYSELPSFARKTWKTVERIDPTR